MSSGPFFDQPGRDGRRKSDPLKDVDGSPAVAPDWQLYRKVLAADPGGFITNPKLGLNCGHYNKVKINFGIFTDATLDTPVEPTGGATTIAGEILLFNPQMKRFLSQQPADTFFSAGAGESYWLDLDSVRGSLIFVKFTAAIQNSEVVAIYAQGYELDHSL